MAKKLFSNPGHVARFLRSQDVPWGSFIKTAPRVTKREFSGEEVHRIYPPVYMPQGMNPQLKKYLN